MALRNANELKRNNQQKNAINIETKRLISIFSSEITEAYNNSLLSVSISVPIHFTINGMSNSEACKAIYSELIKELVKNNYDPRIETVKDGNILNDVIFHISWLSKAELRNKKQEAELLARYSYK